MTQTPAADIVGLRQQPAFSANEMDVLRAEIDALHALQSGGWRPISETQVWDVYVVTNGKQAAVSQLAHDDCGRAYWSIDPEDELDWKPTHFTPLPAPPEGEGV